jgi:TonB-linked SusC/RagA family outer membrane protein
MVKLKLLLLAFFIGFSINSWSQKNQVSGVVTDQKKLSVPGVNVVVKGSNSGVSTDFDGKFQINANAGDILVFSYLGFQTIEVAYKGEAKLNVTLTEESEQLREVVIGYGKVKRADVTGSVSSIRAEQIEQANKVDAISALQGQAAGVVVQRTDNRPGSGGFNIRIRGASTINANQTAAGGGFTPGQNPLFIVDGIFLDDISFLNPADISRMDILKDASATAVYGSRGSNGVVIIETKRGKKGDLRVEYSNYIGFKEAYNLPSVMNGSDYVTFLKDVVVGNEFVKTTGNLGYRANDVVLSNYLDAEELKNVADGVSTDWVGLMLQKGLQTNHTLNLSGGTDKTVYGLGLAYTKDEGNIEEEDFNRFNVRGSLKSDLTKWMNLSVSNYITSAIQNTGSWEAFRTAYRLKPIGRPYNDDGSLRFFPTTKETQITNPLFEPANQTRETRFLQYLGDIALQLTPAKGFTFTTKFSPNIKYSRYGEYRGLYSKDVVAQPTLRRATVANSNYFSYSWDNILNYKYAKGDHTVDAIGVISRFMERRENYNNEVRNFTTDQFEFYNLDGGLQIANVSSDFSKQTLESYTGRVNYGFKNKYLLTVTGRYDGSSMLSDKNKWAFFPSAAFGWKMIDEGFMQKQTVLSNAKLRLSYGQTGNNGQGGGLAPLASQALLASGVTNIGDAANSTTFLTGLANENLTWERTTELNLGFDFGFLNDRITGTIDVYNRKNTNIIFAPPLPYVAGFMGSGAFDNVGESTNKGIEIGLNTVNIDKGDFKWTTNFNFSSNKNNLDKLYGGLNEIIFNAGGTNLIHKVGESIGSVYDYEFAGIWQLDQVTQAATFNQRPGQVRVTDVNGDGKITPADRKVLGQVTPKWTGGITSTMNYKNFDFSFFLNISQGNMYRSNFHGNFAWAWQDTPTRTFNGYKVDHWTPERQSNDWHQPGNGGTYASAIYYKDVSFVKMGYITVGYKIPSTVLEKLKISSLRIYGTVQNPFVFTKYDGWDPENAGRDQFGASFMSRTFMTGLNVSF